MYLDLPYIGFKFALLINLYLNWVRLTVNPLFTHHFEWPKALKQFRQILPYPSRRTGSLRNDLNLNRSSWITIFPVAMEFALKRLVLMTPVLFIPLINWFENLYCWAFVECLFTKSLIYRDEIPYAGRYNSQNKVVIPSSRDKPLLFEYIWMKSRKPFDFKESPWPLRFRNSF